MCTCTRFSRITKLLCLCIYVGQWRGDVSRPTRDEVLQALFAMSSDESEDDLDDVQHSDDDGGDDNAGTAPDSLVEVENSDTDDDDISYQLADPDASMDWSSPDDSDTHTGASSNTDDEGEGSDSEWDDPEWHKNPFSAPGVQFDDINVLPKTPFLDTDGPFEFFKRFICDDVIKLLVEQTNLYAKQRGTRYWDDVTYDEMKCFLGILIGMCPNSSSTGQLTHSSGCKV